LFKRLLLIRRSLKDEILSNNVLSKDVVSDLGDWEDFIPDKSFEGIKPFNTSDFILLIDFRDKLYSRNSYIEKGKIDENQLKNIIKIASTCLNKY
jgi:hypothetical protein